MEHRLVSLLILVSVILNIACVHPHRAKPREIHRESPKSRKVKENSDDYVLQAIEKNPELHSFFGSVTEPTEKKNEISLISRFRDDNKIYVCEVETSLQHPLSLTDVDNVERKIVNVGNYTQALMFEKCKYHVNHKCYATFGEECVCKQTYTNLKLMTISTESNDYKLEFKVFPIPSTCVSDYVPRR